MAMIEIQTAFGPTEVPGETLHGGLFAISNTHDRWAKWRVTHLPTGKGIGDFDRKPKAQAYAKALMAMSGIDWSSKDESYLRGFAGRVGEILRANS
jgi:hypothetical protein